MDIKHYLIKGYHSLPQRYQHIGDGYHRIKKFYQQAQWWDRKQIEAWQLARLQEIVKNAYEHTVGYRQLYDEADVSPMDIQSLSDIQYLPFTSKELLRDNVEDFTWRKGNGSIVRNATSGSTGMPFVFFSDRKATGVEYSFMDTLWETTGWSMNDKGLRIRGGLSTDKGHIVCEKIDYNRYAVSSQYLNENNYECIKEFIFKYGITFLHVYPSTIADLAQMVITHGDIDALPIKHIFVGSEKYYPWQYEITKRAFPNSKIMHWYGQSERVILAGWCEENNFFHSIPFYGLTEVVNDNNDYCQAGETGEMVGTSFWMQGTFFIRYKTGDRASVEGNTECSQCGRHFTLLSSIEGRKQDIVIGRSGKKMSLTVFDGWAMHGSLFSNVRLFRFIQNEAGLLTLLVLPKHSFNNKEFIDFQTQINVFFGDDYSVAVRMVNEIPRSKSGKYSYLEQHIKID